MTKSVGYKIEGKRYMYIHRLAEGLKKANEAMERRWERSGSGKFSNTNIIKHSISIASKSYNINI